jgi:putative flippase GtrA
LTAAWPLYQRFRQLIREGAAFCVVGGLAFLIVVVGSNLLRYDAGLGKYVSVTIATVVATAFSFAGNRYWTFRHRKGAGTVREAAVFFALNGVGLLIQYATIGLVTEAFGLTARIWYTVSLVLGVGLGTLFRFWAYRKWVWVLPESGLATLRGGKHRKRAAGYAAAPAGAEAGARLPGPARARSAASRQPEVHWPACPGSVPLRFACRVTRCRYSSRFSGLWSGRGRSGIGPVTGT